MTICFLEQYFVMIPMELRKTGCSVVESKDIIPEKVAPLANAANDCWNAISITIFSLLLLFIVPVLKPGFPSFLKGTSYLHGQFRAR